MNKVAYLGGPMRSLPLFNFPAFEAATAALRAKGWTIYSPAEHDLEGGFDPATTDMSDFNLADALVWDFQKIMESSCLIVLPGWETSTGTTWEATVAYATGKPVFQYPELTPVELPVVVTDPVRARIVTDAWQPYESVGPWDDLLRPSYAHMRGVDGPGAWERHPGDVGPHSPVDRLNRFSATGERRVVDPTTGGARVKRPDAFDKALIWEATVAYATGKPMFQYPEAGGKLGEVRVVDPETGGAKGSKPERFDLIPADVMEELARHYGRGCQKYADRNWQKGYKWSLSIAALERHLNLWKQGQDIDHDPEIGDFPHLIAVIWHAIALLWFQNHAKGTDDRDLG